MSVQIRSWELGFTCSYWMAMGEPAAENAQNNVSGRVNIANTGATWEERQISLQRVQIHGKEQVEVGCAVVNHHTLSLYIFLWKSTSKMHFLSSTTTTQPGNNVLNSSNWNAPHPGPAACCNTSPRHREHPPGQMQTCWGPSKLLPGFSYCLRPHRGELTKHFHFRPRAFFTKFSLSHFFHWAASSLMS